MPGRGSYGPGGKWIYQRAARLRAKNPDMDESTSFAVATQQAHKVGKSPKRFRTAEGVATAKAKMSGPLEEYRKTAMLAGMFDELEKAASVAAAARFGAGVLLGSLLWNSLGTGEKKELKEKAEQVTGEKRMPPIIITMPGRERSIVERELGKPDPDFRGVMGDLFKRPEDLERERRIRGIRQMWKGAAAQLLDAAQARKNFATSKRVGLLGSKKPPEPNVRAVATKV